jgi:hypothetical protein
VEQFDIPPVKSGLWKIWTTKETDTLEMKLAQILQHAGNAAHSSALKLLLGSREHFPLNLFLHFFNHVRI